MHSEIGLSLLIYINEKALAKIDPYFALCTSPKRHEQSISISSIDVDLGISAVEVFDLLRNPFWLVGYRIQYVYLGKSHFIDLTHRSTSG